MGCLSWPQKKALKIAFKLIRNKCDNVQQQQQQQQPLLMNGNQMQQQQQNQGLISGKNVVTALNLVEKVLKLWGRVNVLWLLYTILYFLIYFFVFFWKFLFIYNCFYYYFLISWEDCKNLLIGLCKRLLDVEEVFNESNLSNLFDVDIYWFYICKFNNIRTTAYNK